VEAAMLHHPLMMMTMKVAAAEAGTYLLSTVYSIKPNSERSTQLNSTQPVLKMFRTSPTGKKLSDFQFFSCVELS